MVKVTADSECKVPLPESIRAEAAVWLARLHSDTRSEQTEIAFRRWLAADGAHRAAFERLTNTWEATSDLRRRPATQTPSEGVRRSFRRGLMASAATVIVCALIAAAALYLMRSSGTPKSQTLATAIGERRSLRLTDGSELTLNTDSRVRVTFSSGVRLLTLEKGQARFDVAPNPARPFVVAAGGKQIIAVGTAFDVRWTDAQLSVVLLQGHVAVLPADEHPGNPTASAVTLEPGERLRFERSGRGVRSAARMEREEAWLTGRAVFEAARLDAAIAEMNRYSSRKLALADPELGELRISGTFSVDDSAAFARALAQMLSLRITSSDDSILLTRATKHD